MEVAPEFQRDTSALSLIYLRSRSGKLVSLDTVATLRRDVGPLTVNHLGQVPAVTLSFNLKSGVSLGDATAAIASMGYSGRQGEHMVAVENTPARHNMVVCTLCSCYPWPVLGLPPTWYKSAPYRSRAVRDPRGVLADFGVVLPESTEIRVWDSTAEVRYLVIPERPAGTEGWSEEQLAELVTRDSMIGTGLPKAPSA